MNVVCFFFEKKHTAFVLDGSHQEGDGVDEGKVHERGHHFGGQDSAIDSGNEL
jgi:hypothetical protein